MGAALWYSFGLPDRLFCSRGNPNRTAHTYFFVVLYTCNGCVEIAAARPRSSTRLFWSRLDSHNLRLGDRRGYVDAAANARILMVRRVARQGIISARFRE